MTNFDAIGLMGFCSSSYITYNSTFSHFNQFIKLVLDNSLIWFILIQ